MKKRAKDKELEQKTDAVMDIITATPGSWTLARTAYTLREDIYQKISRREKFLQSKPIAWLRTQSRSLLPQKKSELIRLLLVKQFGLGYTDQFFRVKAQR